MIPLNHYSCWPPVLSSSPTATLARACALTHARPNAGSFPAHAPCGKTHPGFRANFGGKFRCDATLICRHQTIALLGAGQARNSAGDLIAGIFHGSEPVFHQRRFSFHESDPSLHKMHLSFQPEKGAPGLSRRGGYRAAAERGLCHHGTRGPAILHAAAIGRAMSRPYE